MQSFRKGDTVSVTGVVNYDQPGRSNPEGSNPEDYIFFTTDEGETVSVRAKFLTLVTAGLRVGDKVVARHGRVLFDLGEVIDIRGDWAWIEYTEDGTTKMTSMRLDALTRYETTDLASITVQVPAPVPAPLIGAKGLVPPPSVMGAEVQYTSVEGDTVEGIAREFEVDASDLLEGHAFAPGWRSDDELPVGTVFTIIDNRIPF